MRRHKYAISLVRNFNSDAKDMFLKNCEKSKISNHMRMLSKKTVEADMSVLLPLVTVQGTDSVILTKRSIHLRSHRGEVCFPGGRRDKFDNNLIDAALRETFEEIGVHRDQIDVWGPLASIVRRQNDGFVSPYVGWIRDDTSLHRLTVSADEVQAVFSVSLDELARNARFTKFKYGKFKFTLPSYDTTEFKVHHNAADEYLHSKQRIWGLTAIMLHQLLTMLVPGYKHDKFIKIYQST